MERFQDCNLYSHPSKLQMIRHAKFPVRIQPGRTSRFQATLCTHRVHHWLLPLGHLHCSACPMTMRTVNEFESEEYIMIRIWLETIWRWPERDLNENNNKLTWPLTSGTMAAATGRTKLMFDFIAAVLVVSIVVVIDEFGHGQFGKDLWELPHRKLV